MAGFCRFDNYLLSKKDFEQYEELLDLAMIKPEEIYLFSKAGFSEDVRKIAREMTGVKITLVGLEDL